MRRGAPLDILHLAAHCRNVPVTFTLDRMDAFYIALPLWLLCALTSYVLRERAIGRLSAVDIGTVTLARRGDRLRVFASAIAGTVVYLALRVGLPQYEDLWLLLLVGAVISTAFVFVARDCRAYFSLLPPDVARSLTVAKVVGLVALLSLAGAIVATVL
jgi:hypothetical protein